MKNTVVVRKLLLFLGTLLWLSPSQAQTTNDYYLNFNISGPASICPDGTTTYTYSGPIEELVWVINGGQFVGSSYGSSVTVRWTSSTGSLSASGTYTEQECWYEPDISPPVLYCNTDNYHYTSNPFNISSSVVTYQVSGGGFVCSVSPVGVNITLSGSLTSYTYQLKRDGVAVGSPVTGTGGELTWANQVTPGSYTVTSNGACPAIMNGTAYITEVANSVGGTASGSLTVCGGISDLYFDVTGYTGEILRWEKNNGSGWTTIPNTSNTIEYHHVDFINSTTSFRAVVRSGVYGPCQEAYSTPATITVDPMSVGGSVTSSTTACSSASGTLTLGGHTGTVVRWERNTGSGWTTISNNTTTQNYNVSATTSYRAILKNGTCPEVASNPATITIVAASVGGTLYQSVSACFTATDTLWLYGQTGTIQRWEFNDGGGWSAISNTDTFQPYSLTASRQYRVAVKNGICPEAFSSVAAVTVEPPSVGGTISGGGMYCSGASGTLTLNNHTGSVHQWEKNTASNWTVIANTTNSLNYSNATVTTEYRAWVVSGTCSGAYSSVATVAVDASTVSGTLSHYPTAMSSSSAVLQLGGQAGNVVRWEQNSGSSWDAINVTTTSYSVPFSNLTSNTHFRAVVKNGVCAEVPTPAVQVGVNHLVYTNTVSLVADAAPSYEWYKDGFVIPNETQQTYTANQTGIFLVKTPSSSLTTGVFYLYPSFSNQIQKVNAVSSTAILKKGVTEATSLYSLLPHEISQVISYQDGVGRPFQTVAVGASPSCYDIISAGGPGKQGLTDTTYLPYVATIKSGMYRPNALRGSTAINSYTISEQYLFYQGTAKVATDNYPYARTLYRNTPDAKVVEQGAPGADWQLGGSHTVRNVMALNNATTYRVRYWKADGTTNSNYPDNSVAVSVATDENNNQVRTFMNSLGQTVLKQVQIDETLEGVATTWLETYYIFNDLGSLIYIVPPKAMKVLGTGTTLNALNSSVSELIYTYKYDSRSRLIEKKEPGATTWQYLVYDIYDRLVLIQNADLKAVNKWMFIKYDKFSRAVVQGLYTNSKTRLSVQNWASKAYTASSTSYPEANYTEDRSNAAGGHGYTNRSFPKDTIQYMGVNYFDDYDFNFDGMADYSYDNTHLQDQETTNSNSTRGLATGGKQVVIDELGTVTNHWLVSVTFYDKYDRAIQTRSNSLLSTEANNLSTVVYDFPGKVLKAKTSNAVNRITWQNMVGSSAETDRLISTAASAAWGTSGAFSIQQIPAGMDGWVETTVTEINKQRMFGFSDNDVNQHYNTIDYAFYMSSGTLYIFENGANKLNVSGGEAVGDKLRIVRTGTAIKYYKNGTLVYTSLTASSSVLMADVAFYNVGATIGYTQISVAQATSVATTQRYAYDHAGRVLAVYHTIDNNPEQQVAAYEYNALGQVADKKLHHTGGGNFLQSVDLRYSIRGWLKSINNAQLLNDGLTNDDTGDYFGMELVYNQQEIGMGNTSYYNGNISAVKWKGIGTTGAADQRSYKYVYDKSDRLKTATFQAHDGSVWNKEANTLNEGLTYDHNGNIKTLLRNKNQRGLSGTTVTSTPQAIDNLTYTYTSNYNKLTKVEDATADVTGFKNGVNTTTEYQYGTNGSLTKDDNKGISNIYYNMLGKPRQIVFTDGRKIDYVYDGGGNKLKTKNWQGTTAQAVTEYQGSLVYVNGTLSFFSSPEGRVVKNGSNYVYEYAIADHQGNTRAVFTSATPAPDPKTADMEAATNNDFQNYANRVNFELMDHTDFSGSTYSYSQKLTGGNNAQVGVAKSMKVYPGDKVKIEAYAKYYNPQGTQSNLSGFALALTSAFGVSSSSTGEALKAYNSLNNYGGIIAGGGGGGSSSYPKLFVNILLFDKDYNFLDAAWQQIDGGEQIGATPKAAHDYMMQEVTVQEAGYAYIYVSHENATLVDFYVDDVVVTHTPTNVIQYNEYYPFGMQTTTSWTRENVTGNNFLGNGGTELNTTSNLYDLDYRHYDPVLGRMNGVDPMATKYSSLTPYNFAFNDPVTFNDPSGADPGGYYEGATPIYEQYTGYMYSGTYGWLQDDNIYHRVTGWRAPVARYVGELALPHNQRGMSGNGSMGADWKPGQGSLSMRSQLWGTESGFLLDMYQNTGWVPEWTYTVREYPDGSESMPYNVRLTGLKAVQLNQQTGGCPPGVDCASIAIPLALPGAATGVSTGLVSAVGIAALPFLMTGDVSATQSQRSPASKIWVTYTKRNAAGQVYSGRASGWGTPEQVLRQRDAAHHMNGLGYGPAQLDRFGMGKAGMEAVRGREQQLMDFYGGVGSPMVGNSIRGVSAYNPLGLLYQAASDGMFGNLAPYSGIYKFP